jgi:hypothetical protein
MRDGLRERESPTRIAIARLAASVHQSSRIDLDSVRCLGLLVQLTREAYREL